MGAQRANFHIGTDIHTYKHTEGLLDEESNLCSSRFAPKNADAWALEFNKDVRMSTS